MSSRATRSSIDATAIHKATGAEISALTEKTTPVSADKVLIEDSAAAHAKKYVQIGSLPGGDLSGATVWSPDFPPLSPHASNDEFVGSSLDAKWSVWAPGGPTRVYTVGNGRLVIDNPAGGSNRLAGIFQDAPSGDFAAYAKVSTISRLANWSGIAVMLAEDLGTNPTTAAIRTTMYGSPTNNVAASPYTDWDSPTTNDGQVVDDHFVYLSVYLYIAKSGSNYISKFSGNGTIWWPVAETTHGLSSVDTVGIATTNADASLMAKPTVEWFRIVEGTPTTWDLIPSSQRGVGW